MDSMGTDPRDWLWRALAAGGVLAVLAGSGLGVAWGEEAGGGKEVWRPCRLEVVERGTGWPVPLVEFRTTHQVRFVSDNAGLIALDAPELMGRETWFDVVGHGYGVAKDGFGYRGVRLTPRPGGRLRVEVERTSLARRVGRLTGAGLYAESQKLGLEAGWRESGVFGCDSIQAAEHGGRLYWIWGDTTLAGYPLGVFDVSAATTGLRPVARLEPPLKVEFEYFRGGNGEPRGVARMAGTGPTWLTALVSLPEAGGGARLGASYMKIKPPLEAYEWGLCVWDEEGGRFERLRRVWTKTDAVPERGPCPDGHAVFWADGAGTNWVLFGDPLPTLRCRATFEAWSDPGSWEELKPQETIPAARGGGRIKPHRGSIAWNAWRGRWVTVFTEAFGKPSALGEVWYAEAETPLGPWGGAVKVLSHENYTYYNPRIRAEFGPGGTSWIAFEGTFSTTFADHAVPVGRHDYNQVVYALDLAEVVAAR